MSSLISRASIGCKSIDDRIDVEDRRLDDFLAAECQELACQAGSAHAGFLNFRDLDSPLVAGRDVLEQDLAETENHRQEVVEIVRDAAGEASNRLHFLGLLELRLELNDAR